MTRIATQETNVRNPVIRNFVEEIAQRLKGCEFTEEEAVYLITEIHTRRRLRPREDRLCMSPDCHLMREHTYGECGY